MGQQQSFSGDATPTTASAGIGSGDTTISVVALQGTWPNTAFGPFAVTINRGEADEERCLVSSYSSTLLTISQRGYDGTTAEAHDDGANIEHTLDGAWHQDVSAKVYSAPKGALWYWSAASTPGQLDIGSTGNFLRVSAGLPAWSSIVAADIEALFTAAGQLFVGTGSATGELLSVGSNGSLLQVQSGVPAWLAAGSQGQVLASLAAGVAWGGVLTPTAQSSNYNAKNGDLVILTTGKTVTLPTATAGYMVGITAADGNTSNGFTAGGSAKVFGLGLGTGVAAGTNVPLGTKGAFVVVVSDGTNWYIVAGQQDTGWLPFTYANSYSSSSGPATAGTAAGWRLTGDTVRFGGTVVGGTNPGTMNGVISGGIQWPTYTAAWELYDSTGGSAGGFMTITSAGVISVTLATTGHHFTIDNITYKVD